ncbi:hypothetical protein DBR40_15140 [Pedobacter sp. KBW01]|uniref:DUF4595 domain-containing protein n=1 Tax=Pedobacter sp. KBW01 TaxID=2153364 RepID=UPI000F5ABC22|nr:DUF4595 domain-containing protein [Pedobacter sp. KBW01]RQO72639.1 hypothetical protein DBR40_15140 [Pedobacter sp. KBW01]
MQKTVKYLMVSLIAILAIASCKKEIDWNAFPDPNGGNGCKLATLKADVDFLGSYTIAFNYDAQGRISKLTSGAETNTYVYTTNKITATDETGQVAEIVLENGRAVSSGSDGIITIGGVSYDYTRKYTYNAEGYLIQVKNYLNNELSTTDNLAYANGNLVSAVSIAAHGGYKETITYSYSNDIAMNVYEISDPLSYHVDYFPGGYFGKQSKNVLIKSVSKTIDQDGDPFNDETLAYTYQYDSKGNATSLNYTNTSTFYPSGGPAETETYKGKFILDYTCK